MKNAYGAALRVGNQNVGTLWLLTDEVNLTLLKGICAQISIAISNIRANDKVLTYKQRLEVENDHLKEQIQTIYNFSEIVGSGEQMQKVYHLISLVAESNLLFYYWVKQEPAKNRSQEPSIMPHQEKTS